MRSSALLLLLIPLLLTSPAPVPQDPIPAAATAPAGGPTLKATMKSVNARTKQLAKLLEQPDPEQPVLPLLEELQELALTAKRLQPSRLASVPADQQAAFLVGYRRQLHLLLERLFELELAVMEGRTKDAFEVLAVLDAIKKEGHDEFKGKGGTSGRR